jgi:hypothetical protein
MAQAMNGYGFRVLVSGTGFLIVFETHEKGIKVQKR